MHSNSYENTMAYVRSLNRNTRKNNVLKTLGAFVSAVAEGFRLARRYEGLTLQGVPPAEAAWRVFKEMTK